MTYRQKLPCRWCGGNERHDQRSCHMRAVNADTKHQDKARSAAHEAYHFPILRGSGTRAPYIKENGVGQHRVVAERIMGRKLELGEVVHHEDRDGKNNDPSNLIVFASQADHGKHHQEVGECRCSCIRISKLVLTSSR